MGRFKKGQRQKTTDMWEKAGGREAIVQSFINCHVCEINVPAYIWTNVTLDVFKTSKKEYTNWLKIIWREDRRGVQTAVLHAGNSLQLKFIFLLCSIYLVCESWQAVTIMLFVYYLHFYYYHYTMCFLLAISSYIFLT